MRLVSRLDLLLLKGANGNKVGGDSLYFALTLVHGKARIRIEAPVTGATHS
jgi:hypothetical protein